MPSISVHLDCRNSPSSGSDGYTNTTASNGAPYSFCYSGGTDGHGNVDESVGSGLGIINVSVGGDPRYTISTVEISNNIDGQLSWAPGSSPTTAVITDQDTQSGEGYYQVVVSDSVANCTFPCDPRIKNV